jgi:hypothetical protein
MVSRALAEGVDILIMFHDGSALRGRVQWTNDVRFAYVVPPFPPAVVEYALVRSIRLLK